MELEQAKIIITGGSSGIGKATAIALNKLGAKIVITGRNKDKLEKTAAEIGCFSVHADVSSEEDVLRCYKESLELLGGLNVLINNAGIGEMKALTDIDMSDFQKTFEVNVYGAALMAREAAKIFKNQENGNIINIASTAAQKGFKGGTIYSASKFALAAMTQCWQQELRSFNVRVMQINPSAVMTAFGSEDRTEREEKDNMLRAKEVAHCIEMALTMDDRGFIPEMSLWASNPF